MIQIDSIGPTKIFIGATRRNRRPYAVQYRASFWYFRSLDDARTFAQKFA
jgi:hypothetical protein